MSETEAAEHYALSQGIRLSQDGGNEWDQISLAEIAELASEAETSDRTSQMHGAAKEQLLKEQLDTQRGVRHDSEYLSPSGAD